MDYLYRPIQVNELSQVDQFISQNFDDKLLSGEQVSEFILNLRLQPTYESRLEWVALDQEHLIGHILLIEVNEQRTVNQKKGLFVVPFTVDFNYRTQGVGRQLFTNVVDEAKRRHYPWIIAVGDRGFYHQLGFVNLETTQLKPNNSDDSPDNYMIYFIDEPQPNDWAGTFNLNY